VSSDHHVNTHASPPTTTTMFIKSSENTCCGSVTIQSAKQHEQSTGPALYAPALQDLDQVERQQQQQQEILTWNREEFAFLETPSCDFEFTFVSDKESEGCSALDVCSENLPSAYSNLCHSEAAILSADSSSLGTVLTPSELPLPVRCLLTPPDSVDSDSNSLPPPVKEEEEETLMTMSGSEEMDYSSISPAVSPVQAASTDQRLGGGFLVLTPVTRRPRRTHPGCTTIKYNRRNNPDLDRRRVHFCDFPGTSDVIARLI